MSLRSEKVRSLLGMNLDDLTDDKLKELSSEILKSKIHGINKNQKRIYPITDML